MEGRTKAAAGIALGATLAAAVGAAGTAGKRFYPGVYTEAEKAMLEEALNGPGGPGGPPPGGTADSGRRGPPSGVMAGGARPPLPGTGQAGPTTSTDAPMGMKAEGWAMHLYANGFDPWNPLYNDSAYAAGTRWKGPVAVPFFQEPGGMFPTLGPRPEIGSWNGTNDGGDVEFFLPVRPGDVFRSEQEKPTVVDRTPAEGSDTRVFEVTGGASLYNQKGELVMRGRMFGRNMFRTGADTARGPGGAPSAGGERQTRSTEGPGGGPGGAPPDGRSAPPQGGMPPDGSGRTGGPGGAPPSGAPGQASAQGTPGGATAQHIYTEADWRKIHQIEDAEEIRGAKPRLWDDVKVGDHPAWTIVGPTTTMDMIRCFGLQAMQGPPMRDQLRQKDRLPGLKQDRYGIYHLMEEGHFSEAGMGGRAPIFYMAFGRGLMTRLVTNWMGDDGWLRRFSWRNGSLADSLVAQVPELAGKRVAGHGKVGDVLIAKARVQRRYEQDGEHRVDLVVWTEDFDGTLCQAATATVTLPAKAH